MEESNIEYHKEVYSVLVEISNTLLSVDGSLRKILSSLDLASSNERGTVKRLKQWLKTTE